MLENPEDTWTGAVHATTNARRLYDVACLASQQGDIGCGVALLVLSAEESSKAISVGFHIRTPLLTKDLKHLFRSHSIKHQSGAHATKIIHMMLGLLMNEPEDGSHPHGECGILEYIENWRDGADEIKKRGFYVDYNAGKWITPDQVTKDEFESSLFIATTLLTTAEGFFIKSSLDEFIK